MLNIRKRKNKNYNPSKKWTFPFRRLSQYILIVLIYHRLQKNDQTSSKRLQMVDENSNILNEYDFSHPLIPNEYTIKNENDKQIVNDVNANIINQKLSLTVRSKPLDAIVEDVNEDNSDEFSDTDQTNRYRESFIFKIFFSILFIRLCSDRELIENSNDLHTRLLNLSKMNHVIVQLNDHGYLLGEFTRHIGKLKLKIDDIKRASTDIPRDAELLEAR